MARDSVRRFDDRVENYVKYRPRYPREILPFLEEAIGLSPAWQVADIGAGTGFLAERFVEFGCDVVGVEPNDAMRAAGDVHLSGFANFRSAPGRAEATGLPDGSVDLVTAGQAFHWFDPTAARQEFARILRPPGWFVAVWNTRPRTASAVADAYEAILEKLRADYQQVAARNAGPVAEAAFQAGLKPFARASFPNPQRYSWEHLRGRALSSSYAPLPPDPRHEWFVRELRALFERFEEDGVLEFMNETELFWGRLKETATKN